MQLAGRFSTKVRSIKAKEGNMLPCTVYKKRHWCARSEPHKPLTRMGQCREASSRPARHILAVTLFLHIHYYHYYPEFISLYYKYSNYSRSGIKRRHPCSVLLALGQHLLRLDQEQLSPKRKWQFLMRMLGTCMSRIQARVPRQHGRYIFPDYQPGHSSP